MRALCYLCLFTALTLAARAQTASLRGQVTDETGAVVPGVTVTLTGPDGRAQSTTSDNQGSYLFTGVAPGDYRVNASAPQLAMPRPAAITLRTGVQTLNLVVNVVSSTQKVTIQESAGPAVTTDPSNNAGALVLRGTDLQALSDDPDDLASDLQALAGPSAGPNGGTVFVDGFSGGELPAKDSIREVRINQNPFSPEYDTLGLGRIEVFTKPGADHYRGTLDYNVATDAWNSRNPYSAEKAKLLLNELEGNVAGPINQRASFTFDGQRNTVDNGAVINALTVDPRTLAIEPYFNSFTVPQRFLRASPRVDYRIDDNNTLILRYSVTDSDINGASIGGFSLASLGYDYRYLNQTVQASETDVLGSAVNDTRFQYFRSAAQRIAMSPGPEIQVIGAFSDGGSPMGQSFDTQNTFELQNYTALTHGAHLWKWGVRLRGYTENSISPNNFNGTFTFDSIQAYQQTLRLYQVDSPAEVRAAGGGAAQFSISSGAKGLALHQEDVGAYVGDDWRIRPNFTMSGGLRWETQTNIHDWTDFAPRLAIAWAPAATAKKPRPSTVLRAGFGTFYDRFPLADILTARRFNGSLQQQYVVTNPDFTCNSPLDVPTSPPFSCVPPVSALQASPQVIQELSSTLRAPYILQSSATLERQLPANTTLAVTYSNSHGLHMLRSEDVNAPAPGTYQRGVPGSGQFPLGAQHNPVFVMESSGLYNQNQLIVNVNSRVNEAFSLFGFYVLNRALSSTDGLSTFPANPYNFTGEYGPAATDIRHRATLGGSINTRWNIRLSPFVTIQSGAPFDITAGSDLYGTTLFNGRPGFANDPAKPGLVLTSYGLLDPNPSPDERLVPRNYGRGPGLIAVNLRLSKTFGFGGEHGESAKRPAGGPLPNGSAANPNLASGRGLGSVIAAPTTSHRYNFSVSLAARNVLNHTNPGPIIGDITSPLFGQANQTAGNLNGEGFSENSDNRRLELQMRFTF